MNKKEELETLKVQILNYLKKQEDIGKKRTQSQDLAIEFSKKSDINNVCVAINQLLEEKRIWEIRGIPLGRCYLSLHLSIN